MRVNALAVAGLVLACGCGKTSRPAALDASSALDAGGPLTGLAAIIASCARTSGEVKVRRAGVPYWEDVAPGTVFRAGDWLKTGHQGAARIEFLAGGGLELDADAVVIVDTPAEKPAAAPDGGAAPATPVVAVESGEVRAFIGLDLNDEPAPLVIRNADGSQVRLERKKGEPPVELRLRRGEKGTEVAVTEGAATMVGADGASHELRHGQFSQADQGQVSAPAELITFPESVEPGIDARFWASPDLVMVKLAWSPVPGASGYRVQIARDLSFQAMVQSTDVAQGTSYSFVPPDQGSYAWHVASRDAAGRYGEFGFARRFYLEKEKPRELLIGPLDGATYTFIDVAPKLSFSWQSAADAKSYRLVIATGTDLLRTAKINVRSTGQRAEVSALPPGEYLWGAYIEGKVLQPIFLKPRHLVIRQGDKGKLKTPKKINQWGD